MGHTSRQISTAKTTCDLLLLIAITVVTIAAVKIIQLNFPSGNNWFLTPGILIAAAAIAMAIRRKKLPKIGLYSKKIKYSFVVLAWTCLSVLPAMFCGLWLLKFYDLSFPLQPRLPQNQQLAGWIFYQFMYVAVAEEIFFRGFLQGGVQRLLIRCIPKRQTLQCCLSVVISAICFAGAHMVIQESVLTILIIAPGLILGWLYIRTNSLLAPMLFHGIANVSYFLMASALAQ